MSVGAITTEAELAALPERTAVVDRMGDVGTVLGGMLRYPETAPQTFERAAKKYGPFHIVYSPPAPEPEYVDTLSAVIFEEIGKSPDDHALAADLAAAAVRERFVAIDLTGLRERLADVARAKFGGPTDAWFDFADATLAELGLEVAPTIDVAPEPEPEWKPGTVGTATVQPFGADVRVLRSNSGRGWYCEAGFFEDAEVTGFVPDEPRPLPTRNELVKAMHDDYLKGGEPRLTVTAREHLADAVLTFLRGESR